MDSETKRQLRKYLIACVVIAVAKRLLAMQVIVKLANRVSKSNHKRRQARIDEIRAIDAADEAEWIANSVEVTFYVVVSGEFTMSEEDIGEDHTLLPLNDKGRAQAALAAEDLARKLQGRGGALRVISSDERHVMETAMFLTKVLGGDQMTRSELYDPYTASDIVDAELAAHRDSTLVVVMSDDLPIGVRWPVSDDRTHAHEVTTRIPK